MSKQLKYFKALFFLAISTLGMNALAQPLSEIREIADLSDILEFTTEDTLVIFDLDKTLITSETGYGSADWFYCVIEKEIKSGKSKKSAIVENYPRWKFSQKVIAPKMTQGNVLEVVSSLKTQSFDVVALTSRQPMVAKETLAQLERLKLDFSKDKNSYNYPGSYPATYQYGVVFAHDLNPKSEIFSRWFSDYLREVVTAKKIKNIIFVDDSKRHVLDMAGAASKFGFNYLGVHYTGYQRQDFSCELANAEEELINKALKVGNDVF